MKRFINKFKKGPALSRAEGFTIIELIVVIAIIAVLAGIVLVNVQGYVKKAQNAKVLADLESYVKALELAYAQNGSYPSSGNAEVCLGQYQSGACWNGTVAVLNSLNSALSPFLPGPPGNENKVCNSFGNCFNGYKYLNDSLYSKIIRITYLLAGTDQSCGVGSGSDWYGATYCTYMKSY